MPFQSPLPLSVRCKLSVRSLCSIHRITCSFIITTPAFTDVILVAITTIPVTLAKVAVLVTSVIQTHLTLTSPIFIMSSEVEACLGKFLL